MSKELNKEKLRISNHNTNMNNNNNNNNQSDNNSNGIYVAPNTEEELKIKEIISKYGTVEEDDVKRDANIKIKSHNINVKNYSRKIIVDDTLHKEERGFTNNQIQLKFIDSNSNNNNINNNDNNDNDAMNGIEKFESLESNGFASTINFFDDLITVSEQLKNADPKVIALRAYMKEINKSLPAVVYIPFFTQQIRTYIVLNIVPTECRVFSTKERSPFYIVLELYCPELEEKYEQEEKLPKNSNQIRRIPDWKREYNMSSPQTVYNNQQSMRMGYQQERSHSKSVFERIQFQTISDQQKQFGRMTYQEKVFELEDLSDQENSLANNKALLDQNLKKESTDSTDLKTGIACAYQPIEEDLKQSQIKEINNNNNNVNNLNDSSTDNSSTQQIETFNKSEDQLEIQLQTENNNSNINVNVNHQSHKKISNSHIPNYIDMTNSNRNSSNPNKEIQIIPNGEKINIKIFAKKLFGEDQEDQEKRIKKKSPFGHLKSWKLVHFIVKTEDNLKQEQFAQQLIYQFDQIFKDSGLNLLLRPYEIVSLGPNCGIIEVVKNSVTIDGLKRTLHEQYKKPISLNQFFKLYYGSNLKKAQSNFCSSLAAYSLVCYFLQIKDRHNGNILLHKEGYIIHIDFGFLLSNAPGKGLAFENNVPFKLLTEYIDILGGLDSDMFKTYRQLFYRGFQAARKNQDKILLLVKMLYSSHGASLPCFEKGEEAIKSLEERFNPKKIKIDSEFFVHTNELINQSLDNWKSRWYDKWQYFCQGIFY